MRHLLILSILVIVAGCTARPEVQVTLVDTRTALENQVLGSYKELNKEFVMIASVRSVDEKGMAEDRLKGMSASQRDAMKAMQAREFNRDDVDNFKKNGCVGENNTGLLEILLCDRAKEDAKYEKLLKDIVKEENDSRTVIMKRVIIMNEGLKEEDFPKIQKVFARMNQDAAKSGELIQKEDGSFVGRVERRETRLGKKSVGSKSTPRPTQLLIDIAVDITGGISHETDNSNRRPWIVNT